MTEKKILFVITQQLPCFDVENVTSTLANEKALIKKCLWKGLDVNCSAIFKTFPSDRGMCCTFNMAAAEEMFEKTQYTEMVEKMQKNDGNLSFFNDTVPNWYQRNGKCFTFYFELFI